MIKKKFKIRETTCFVFRISDKGVNSPNCPTTGTEPTTGTVITTTTGPYQR